MRRRGAPHRRVLRAVAQVRAARIALLPDVKLYQREDPYDDREVRALLDTLVSGARQYRRCYVELHRAMVGDLTIPKRTRVYFCECVMRGRIRGCGTIVINGCTFVQRSNET